ncbi:hypothetical protein CANINC_001363 [Pichia inconspicua]|uniref:Dolichyl-diphosphooligosaccharide--protein glycosyltransferase subunit WBP1 n=1 Tax=Pichia inconspicua TaxID=52247 RepID=A0A4T0X526_9ASCO|nr:hypothetical protein CANINC_001363 [[Candida] inconspicua]
MLSIHRVFITLVMLLACTVFAKDVLVFVDELDSGNADLFVNELKNNGLDVIIQKTGSTEKKELFDINEKNIFDNLVIFPTKSKKLASNIDHDSLLHFSDNGGNIIVISNDEVSQLDSTVFLNQLGIYPSPKGYKYIDHHAEDFVFEGIDFLNDYIISAERKEKISFNNASIALVSNSEYLIPLLQTTRTSVTKLGEQIWHAGNQGYFAVSFQGLNNARVSWIGSSDVLNDVNLAQDFIQWTFQLKGVIKATRFNHKRVDANGVEIPFVDEDDYYKVKDFSSFEIGLSEYDSKTDSWVPFVAKDAVQFEFIMLDPYQRLNLELTDKSENESIYSTIFQVPDQHGMFTFSVDYKRPGLSYISEQQVVPVRHLANDEYARSWEIPNSKVYIAGYAIVVVSWIIFVFVFVFSQNKNIDSGKKKV